MRLDIDLLAAFVAVVDTGGFTRAAEKIHLTQSTVSLQIKRLEELTGTRLVDRQSRGIRLTSQGEILLSYARRMLELNSEAVSRVVSSKLQRRVLRIGTSQTFAQCFLGAILHQYAALFPGVSLDVRCKHTAHLLSDLDAGLLDVVIGQRDRMSSGGILLMRQATVWLGVQGLRLDTDSVRPIVASSEGCWCRAAMREALDRAQIPWRIAYTSPSLPGLLAALEGGLGVTAFQLAAATAAVQTADLEFRDDLPELPDAELAFVSASDADPELVDGFLAAVRQTLHQEDERMELVRT